MDESKRKLIVLLCMHRSGSSLTANLLEKLGMSLGPFELLGVAPSNPSSNPYGHFESIPFYSLNQKVQQWAFGFADDLPVSPETEAQFLDGQGAWPVGRAVPQEWLAEGERITRALIESGPLSGFKDPRTVLVWPFWQQVFQAIENLEVVPVVLLRSPHEIAMSLCSRTKGNQPYWNALDLVGAHLTRMKAVFDEHEECAHVVRYATPHFRSDLQRMTAACGLAWNGEIADQVYDPLCVHHFPAIVSHPAQKTFDVLSGGNWAALDPDANALRIAEDSRRSESMMHRRLLETQGQLRENVMHLTEAGKIAHAQQARAVQAEQLFGETQTELAEISKAYDVAKLCLAQAETSLASTMESLVSSQERRVQAEQLLAHTQGVLSQTEHSLVETQRHLIQTQELLVQSQSTDRQRLDDLQNRFREAQERITRIHDLTIQKDDQLRLALEREETRWLETVQLRRRLERFESNAFVGVALKGRRQLKQIWLKFRHRGPQGENRTTRIDRPL